MICIKQGVVFKWIDIKNDHDFENNIKNDQKVLKISKMTTHAFHPNDHDNVESETAHTHAQLSELCLVSRDPK